MDYQLIRSQRKTLCVEIRPDGSLLVRAPARMPKREIDTFLLRKADWIEKHLPKAPLLPAFIPLARRGEALRCRPWCPSRFPMLRRARWEGRFDVNVPNSRASASPNTCLFVLRKCLWTQMSILFKTN